MEEIAADPETAAVIDANPSFTHIFTDAAAQPAAADSKSVLAPAAAVGGSSKKAAISPQIKAVQGQLKAAKVRPCLRVWLWLAFLRKNTAPQQSAHSY